MNLLEDIQNKLKYDRKPLEKRLSASQLTDDLLQIGMSIKYGSIDNDFNQAHIGSLIHKGLEHLFINSEKYKTELDVSTVIDDWSITGTVDLIDEQNKAIYDFKTTKYNTYKMLKKAIEKGDFNNSYIWQLNLYRYLLQKDKNMFIDKMYLFFILKDGGWDYTARREKPHYKILEIPMISNLDIENKIYEVIRELDKAITYNDNGEITDINLKQLDCNSGKFNYITTKSGTKLPARCELYCSYKNVCNLYNAKERNKFLDGWR